MNIILNNITKKYGHNEILKNFNLSINRNSSLAILGDSGKGKSTLLNIIALFEDIDDGEIIIDGLNVTDKEFNKMLYWRYKLGYLFQNYALVDNLSVEKNLQIAIKYLDKSKKDKQILIEEALGKVGLLDKYRKQVYTLSGGEQQRLAFARLMIKPCDIVLADEPTGALDLQNRNYIIELLKKIQEKNTLIIVTHDKEVAKICNNIIEI
ncbi:MAG: ATP-binding cassette domain-containing protein [Peptostreptococcaceae bacterium]|uniref:ATP-binding cassette domain-containing protein n=1 Tax=Clostridium sp. TaxID=1506 RepID=UPI002907956D|nr:ATP-binding cassette domain-containing protein [Clostridium sp.]MDU6274073.1 ATP-binding cassette domain-containing protein [Clostridium sp.]MDU7535451.1 ATP-binding cassette domain-containing protein [Peptostreptococcaceae bacterium]